MLGESPHLMRVLGWLPVREGKKDISFFPCTPPPLRYSSHTLEMESSSKKTQHRPCETPFGGGDQQLHPLLGSSNSIRSLQLPRGDVSLLSHSLWAKPQQRPQTSSTGAVSAVHSWKQSSGFYPTLAEILWVDPTPLSAKIN